MGAWAYPAKDGSYFVKRTIARLPEHDTAGDNHGNFCSGTSGAGNRQFASDSRNPLAHSLQTKVPFFAVIYDCRVDADAIVFDVYGKIMPIFQLNFQSTPPRVRAGIANRLIANAVELVADDRMHLLCVSSHRKRHFNWTNQLTLFRCPLEGFRQVVLLRG
jgi:hypothetical protein